MYYKILICVSVWIQIFNIESASGISTDPNDVTFYLYPNPADPNDYDEIIYQDVSSVLKSRYDHSKNLIMYTSGFLQNRTTDQAVKNAYLSSGYTKTSNVMIIDFGPLSGNQEENPFANAPVISNLSAYLSALPLYIAAAGNVPIVGQRVAEFINFLNINKMLNSASSVHLIGQSLGAHVCGSAGSYYKSLTGTALGRISGTDPAGPLFQLYDASARLDPTDATFVDTVHTNAGAAGFVGNLGTVDFFVNSVSAVPVQVQPTCVSEVTNVFCSHNLALVYFAKSIIQTNLMATNCNTVPLLCYMFGSPVQTVVFGQNVPTSARGPFYINNLSPDY